MNRGNLRLHKLEIELWESHLWEIEMPQTIKILSKELRRLLESIKVQLSEYNRLSKVTRSYSFKTK
jgi:hypothetical protein